MPITPFIGVRISWLILARNSLLARLAASAASLARCISAGCPLLFSNILDNAHCPDNISLGVVQQRNRGTDLDAVTTAGRHGGLVVPDPAFLTEPLHDGPGFLNSPAIVA